MCGLSGGNCFDLVAPNHLCARRSRMPPTSAHQRGWSMSRATNPHRLTSTLTAESSFEAAGPVALIAAANEPRYGDVRHPSLRKT